MGSLVSIVLPVYNEAGNLGPLVAEIEAALAGIHHEIVTVDDGSTDGSLHELLALKEHVAAVRVFRFPANRGQSAAMLAGIEQARGEIVVTLDSDGQNDPADIPRLLAALESRPDAGAVIGFRVNRQDSRWKLVQSRIANRARDLITGDSVRDTGCSLKAMRVEWARRLPRFNAVHRFLPTLIRAAGGLVLEVPVSHRARVRGVSKYGMWDRLFRGLRDSLGVRWLARRTVRTDVTGGKDGTEG